MRLPANQQAGTVAPCCVHLDYPTLLAGPVVVKLFGHFGSWRRSYTAELAADRAVESNDAIAAPTVLGTGRLLPGAATMAESAADRQRAWGSLPPRFVDQIDDYFADYRPVRPCLVHADITEHHLFVDGGELVGIIDWDDAMVTDPYYELGALHLGAFGADVSLLAAFLHGYGWQPGPRFARHAMQVALMHQFDLFQGVSRQVQASGTLEDLADALWQPTR